MADAVNAFQVTVLPLLSSTMANVDAAVAVGAEPHVDLWRCADEMNESGSPAGNGRPARSAGDDRSATTGIVGLARAGNDRRSIQLVASRTRNGDATLK